MNRFLSFLSLLFIAFACQKEQDAELANQPTFLRYYGSEYSHNPQQVVETDDGFVLLNNIDIPATVQGQFNYKIKLIKTDINGNVSWQRTYPADFSSETSYRAYSIIRDGGGYVIVGEEINAGMANKLLVLVIDSNGDLTDSRSFAATDNSQNASIGFSGKGIVKDNDGYIALASVSNNGTEDMLLLSFNFTNDTQEWLYYGSGSTSLSKKLLKNPEGHLIWAGTWLKENTTSDATDIRFIRVGKSNQTAYTDSNYTSSDTFTETCEDIAAVFGGYALVGTTNEGGNTNILVTKVTNNGTFVFTAGPFDFDNLNDEGVAVSGTFGGGIVLLGNGETGTSKGFGSKDLYILKLSPSGEVIWDVFYGGPALDRGASIQQTKDGGFIVLGSTEFGANFRKLILLKIDKNGMLN